MRAHLFSLGGSLEYLTTNKSELDQLFGNYWVNISQIMTKVEDSNQTYDIPTSATTSDSENIEHLIKQQSKIQK